MSDKEKQLENNDVQNRERELSSIDRLFRDVKMYRNSEEFMKKLDFYASFPYLGVYNAELVDQQRPGARLVLTAKKWEKLHHRKIKPNARPVIILVPFYPVEFLFDISDTMPSNEYITDDDRTIEWIINKHKASCIHDLGFYFRKLKDNLAKHGIFYDDTYVTGSEINAEIREDQTYQLSVKINKDHSVLHKNYFTISVNWKANGAEQLASISHELGHLFCHHIQTPWWKSRPSLTIEVKEFEAETVSYLVCERLGIETKSAEYLANYVYDNEEIPDISVDFVFRAVDMVQQVISGYLDVTDALMYKHDEMFKTKVDKEKERIKEEKEREKARKQEL